jgi:ethanolamine utilization protein EutQ (cupin superfamily)
MSDDDIARFKPCPSSENIGEFGPATIEKRTAATSLNRLGTSFMEFMETGTSEDWTLRYEETIYVLEGTAEVDVVTADSTLTVPGAAGDLIALPEGTTVRYRGQKGTQLLLSITPVNWRDLV